MPTKTESIDESQDPSPFKVAQAEWNACRIVHEFVNGRARALVEQAATARAASDPDYFRDVLLRMLAWTHTVAGPYPGLKSRKSEPSTMRAITSRISTGLRPSRGMMPSRSSAG